MDIPFTKNATTQCLVINKGLTNKELPDTGTRQLKYEDDYYVIFSCECRPILNQRVPSPPFPTDDGLKNNTFVRAVLNHAFDGVCDCTT